MGTFLIRKTNTGYAFHLKAGNGEIIGTSQVYTSKDNCKTGIESVRKNAGSKMEDQTAEGYETLTNPKYEIYLDKAGRYRFRLRASNGETILASQGYTAKASCKNGIESIGKNAPDAEIVDETHLPPTEEEYDYAGQDEAPEEGPEDVPEPVQASAADEEPAPAAKDAPKEHPSSCGCGCKGGKKPEKKKLRWKFWKRD